LSPKTRAMGKDASRMLTTIRDRQGNKRDGG